MSRIVLLLGLLLEGGYGSPLSSLAAEEPEIVGGNYTCGQASLYAVARSKGVQIEWPEIARALPARTDGTNSFAQIYDAAMASGLHPVAARVDRQRLLAFDPPAILHFSSDAPGGNSAALAHVAVAIRWNSNGVLLLDPPRRARFVPWSAIQRLWTGNALLFPDSEQEARTIEAGLSPTIGARFARYGAYAFSLAAALLLLVALRRNGTVLRSSVSRAVRSMRPVTRFSADAVSRLTRRLARHARLSLAAAATLCFAAMVLTTLSLARSSRQPRLDGPSEILEQGILSPGEHRLALAIKNIGGAPLVVTKIESSCTCALAEVPDRIEPGQTKGLTAIIRVAPGPRYAYLTIHSNDPSGPRQFAVHWNGKAIPSLLVKDIVDQVPSAAEYHRKITIAYPGGYSAVSPELVRYECDHAGLKVEAAECNPVAIRTDGESNPRSAIGYLAVNVTVAPPSGKSEFEAKCTLILKCGDEEQKLPFRVHLAYRNNYRANPNSAVFSGSSAATIVGQTRVVELVGWDSSLKCKLVSSPDWLSCVVAKQQGGRCELQLTVVKAPRSQFVSDTIVTQIEGRSTIKFPVYAITASDD